MIAQLTGILLESTSDTAIVDVQGVGYEVFIPLSTAEKLPQWQHQVTLFTTMVVREDAITLYGFATRQEKRLFETITNSVKGFGPKSALAVLSSMPMATLMQAIAAEDLKLLSKINGVGKKSAAQLVLDMKGHLGEFTELGVVAGGIGAGAVPAAEMPPSALDAVKALETLGYRHDDAQKAIQEILATAEGKDLPTSTLITRALGKFRG